LVPTDVATECTAEVSDVIEAGPFATGTVSFFADGSTAPFATCTIDGAAQVQRCSIFYSTSVVGPHPIVAIYGGDATHTPSTGATIFTVTVDAQSLADASTGSDRRQFQIALLGAALALLGRRRYSYVT
jgi:hypothetical protein